MKQSVIHKFSLAHPLFIVSYKKIFCKRFGKNKILMYYILHINVPIRVLFLIVTLQFFSFAKFNNLIPFSEFIILSSKIRPDTISANILFFL